MIMQHKRYNIFLTSFGLALTSYVLVLISWRRPSPTKGPGLTRFVTTPDGVGRLDGDQITLVDGGYPDLGAALAAGETVRSLAAPSGSRVLPRAGTQLLAPVPRPPKVWIVGKAYDDHRIETGNEPTAEPFTVLIAPTAVTGPDGDIRRPAVAPDCVDYEGELGVIIGATATAISEDQAWNHIAGYTICNDVSARDVQLGRIEGHQANVCAGKSFDTFLPTGPALVTLDEFADPLDLALRTWVDGDLRQDARTSAQIWPVPYVVSFLSHRTTLAPGDLISTGTPAGVGLARDSYLKAGSVVRVEIEGIGAIENRVV
jgi:2-keto-4-pentenoate hydratase/2-oxohepta-3-ene-1,7-dioic acid hydratase in catechol pathway